MECNFFSYFGLVTIVFVLTKFLKNFYDGMQLYFFGAYPDFAKYGEWSIVTGATDGIGRATARVLAEKGQNIVLISRNAAKLDITAAEIRKDYGVETKVVVVDFTDSESIYSEISKTVRDLDVGVLVNNVGIAYEHPEYFLELPNLSATITKMIRGNITSTVKMIELVLPGMVARKRGIILNMSSASALRPTPMFALYSATKDFVSHFSKAISYEYEDQGVKIQCVMPFYVTSKLSKIRNPSLLVPTPEIFAKSMLRGAGATRFTYGYWAHAFQGWVVSLLPDWVYAYITIQQGNAVRKRAYKKKEWQKQNNGGELKKEQ